MWRGAYFGFSRDAGAGVAPVPKSGYVLWMDDVGDVMTSERSGSPSRRERTRQRICEAAHDLFLRRGFNGTTMEEIASAADLRRSTVYNHFRDKEEILAAIGRDYLAAITVIIAQLPSPRPTRAEIDRWIGEFARFAASAPVPTMLLIHSSLRNDGLSLVEDIAQEIMRLYAQRLPAFAAAIEPGGHLAWAKATAALRELSWALCHHVADGGGPRSQAMLQVSGALFDCLVNDDASLE